MPRPPATPATRLAVAVQAKRGDRTLRDVAAELATTNTTLSRIERGTHAPSLGTAVALARWLGWTVEQVVEAAGTPAPLQDGGVAPGSAD